MDPRLKTVAVDLDGTLAEALPWSPDNQPIGPPLKGAKDAMETFRAFGWTIIVYTCRANGWQVRHWCDEYLPGLVTAVNCSPSDVCQYGLYSPKPFADIYIDDKAWPLCGQRPVRWKRIMDDLIDRGILR